MQTTATIYSLVGALNKIPIAIVGIMLFKEASSLQNLASIMIGLGAGEGGRVCAGVCVWVCARACVCV